ncbi:hypothetical protein EDB81DRAFT_762326 [Dactylonectria macrodidyma]|uniref:Uncharacterized protein n=1 Tax=Dactylonectria macrodidyma TaxID=307937 RepID=A0A9P9ECE1_9HYPO|nr:hypothetical protein EDB81DRAFT_762326 [Dactylonectria macrodidyma]
METQAYELVNPTQHLATPRVQDHQTNSPEGSSAKNELRSNSNSGETGGPVSFKWRLVTFLNKCRLQSVLIPFRATRQMVRATQEVPIVQDRLAATLTTLSLRVRMVMMPQEGDWEAGGNFVWASSTYERTFPVTLDESNIVSSSCNISGNPLCPSWEWEVLKNQFVSKLPTSNLVVDGVLGPRRPRNLVLSGAKTLAKLSIDVREEPFDRFSPNYTFVSMPHFVPSDACVLSSVDWKSASDKAAATGSYRFDWYTKAEHRVTAPMPATHKRCYRTSMQSDDLKAPGFPDFRSKEYPVVNISTNAITSWMSDTSGHKNPGGSLV